MYSWIRGEFRHELIAANATHLSCAYRPSIFSGVAQYSWLEMNHGASSQFNVDIAVIRHGRFHYMLLICCGFCLTSVIISTLNTSYLLPSAACDFSMTAQDKGLLNAMCQIGSMQMQASV
ncbi:unnamed protein product [Timema podura]|uniref:Uncharacterized protein n=1 Tax=Timema podura TaxID=61482 RepID=A0ABN7NNG8_TIMPD|nr:unnamed protein product [Timema podura]